MTTKARIMCILAATLCGFCFRFGERSVEAQPPPPCPLHDCKDVYGWWVNGTPGGTQVIVAKEPGTQTNTTFAYPSIYATASSGTLPRIDSGKFDRHIFPTSVGTCYQNKQWQSPQEVVPTGTGKLDQANVTRKVCTVKPIGGEG